MSEERVTRNAVQQLNDAFRAKGPGRDWLATAGVQTLGPTAIVEAVTAIMQFDTFTAANDPYGEHDFGSLELFGEKLFWKIDYYDTRLKFASPDPSDESVTRRVLTILLASEY